MFGAPTARPRPIRVTGAREHNLRDVDVEIPKHTLTVVTGVSGSGKSSLVFDTIAAEASRQLSETLPAFVRGFLPAYGRPEVDSIEDLAATIVVDQRRLGGGSRSTVGTITDIAPLLRLLFSRAGTPHVGYSDAFSFNLPAGMCPACEGLGRIVDVDVAALVDESKSLADGALRPAIFAVGGWMWQAYGKDPALPDDVPIAQFTPEQRDRLLFGTGGTVAVEGPGGKSVNATYEGAVVKFRRLYVARDTAEAGARTKAMLEAYTTQMPCTDCGGARLNAAALSCRIGGWNIAEMAAMEAKELHSVLRLLDVPEATPVLQALRERVGHLVDIGLDYLTLDRPTDTLSGGEGQRVKIVGHLSSTLTDLLYVFDEPSVGLHARDVTRLVALLEALRDHGNTVLVVEHDRAVISAADHVVDLGPGAGAQGGRVTYAGGVVGLGASDTPTGRFLFARATLKRTPRTPTGTLPIRNARTHNLAGIDVDVPTGVLVAVTGVAGSGKSSLIHGDLVAAHPGAIVVDQSAPTTNRRSSVATYTGALDPIRAAFAKANGVKPGLFSANSDGACPTCEGQGVVYTDLAFMEGFSTGCSTCAGRRFTDDVLAYRLTGATGRSADIAEVLDMSAAQAVEFFADHRKISAILSGVIDVGLPYVRLGQGLPTLSGGECQRIKLASHLHRRGALYVLDEPTAGLHASDVDRLLAVLDHLVDDRGASVVVIEHDLDVVAHADWVLDLGPEGGTGGGHLLFAGTPRDLLSAPGSHTGQYLADALRRDDGWR